ncbi:MULTISPECIES: hypothetical protein [unclassified Streptomyces]|uniref:hypothetical protein n=1 Tax=unclassified Streptomyces TaxID=2593676 RepID=UPI00036D7C1D|nr:MULTISPECIES: hypothetical protein [unclassified Streptomyces]MYX39001.1 hypothetical protein [Streptomyces sp. SID8377]
MTKSKRRSVWAVASADYEKHRRSPGVTLRRIDVKEADLRRVERQQIRTLRCLVEDVARTDQIAESWEELGRRHGELAEEIGYWREVIAEAEANGVKIWSRDDFTKGDFVRSGGTWYEVLRVNPKTLTVPYTLNVAKVVTAAEHQLRGVTYPIEYSKVAGRMSGEEMQRVLAEVAARREANQP